MWTSRWIITGVNFLIALDVVFFRPRDVTVQMGLASVAIIFSLAGIRASQPGIPTMVNIGVYAHSMPYFSTMFYCCYTIITVVHYKKACDNTMCWEGPEALPPPTSPPPPPAPPTSTLTGLCHRHGRILLEYSDGGRSGDHSNRGRVWAVPLW